MKKLDSGITIKPKWEKTPDQVWNERFAALMDDDKESEDGDKSKHSGTIDFWRRTRYIWSVAAVVLLFILGTAFIYTKEIKGVPGCACSITLPDGSMAQISPTTVITYHPIVWAFSHRVDMVGEAYFSGHHAKGFSVKTPQGEIEVLGTSFNARTYDDKLIVTCIDGKVKVKTKQTAVELVADMETTLCNGALTTQHLPDAKSAVEWTKGVFSFYNRPIMDVLKDVERYYGIKIGAPQGIDTLRYTGRFTQKKSAQEVLAIIGQPYGLKFEIIK